MNYQKLIIAGNATVSAERKTSKNGDTPYTTFGIGVSDSKDKTTFFNILVFGEYGKAVADHITQGRQVLVEGRIKVNNDGRFAVVADHIWLGAKVTATK